MHLYGFLIGIAIVVGLSVTEYVYTLLGGNKREISRLAYKIILGGFLGARIYHVIDYWQYYRLHLIEILYLWQGGLAIWGGVIGGIVVVICDRLLTREEKWKLVGAICVSLPLAQGVGRVANGVNGEFGELVLGIPWWSLEMILNFILFGMMCWLLSRRVNPKTLVAWYLIGYGVIRLVLEFERDRIWQVGGLPVASIISLFSVIIGVWLLLNAQGFFAICRNKVEGLISRL